MKFLLNPITGTCVMTGDPAYAKRLRSYGWEFTTREVWQAWLKRQPWHKGA